MDRSGHRSCRHFQPRMICSTMIVSGTSRRNQASMPVAMVRKRLRSKPRSTQAKAATPISAPSHGNQPRQRERVAAAMVGVAGRVKSRRPKGRF